MNTFPKEELHHLVAQTKGSARSITANIAEGYGRFNYQETIQFFRIARGSLFETYDHLSSALDDAYISIEKFNSLKDQYAHLLKLLNGYIAYLKRRKRES